MTLLVADVEPGAEAIRDASGLLTYSHLLADSFRLRERVPGGGRGAVRGRAARTVAAAVVALEGWAGRVELLGPLEPPSPAGGTVEIGDATTAGPVADDRELLAVADEYRTRWRLFTSGTTGTPKPIDHTLESLTRTLHRPAGGTRTQRRWGLLYEPTRMAGIQVVLQSLVSGDLLVDATGRGGLTDRVRWLSEHRVDALSATPTLWRQVLQTADPAALPLRQVTLGGEIADQRLLDALARTYPQARITHVFASTETGAAFSVSDGREGFPRSYLTDHPKGVRLDVRDDVLFVEAPGASAAGADGFASTGDLVTVTDDRVLFLGRASGVVNVGGVKVSPEEVEGFLRSHPDVADAVVTSRRNPFSGWILVANVVAAPGAQEADLPARLRAGIGGRLTSAHVPASIRVVPALKTSVTGKAGR